MINKTDDQHLILRSLLIENNKDQDSAMSGEACMGYGGAIGYGFSCLWFFVLGIGGCGLVRHGAREFRLRRRLAQDGVLIQATVTKVKEYKDEYGNGRKCTFQYTTLGNSDPPRRVLVERTISFDGKFRNRCVYGHGQSIDVLMLPEDPLSGRAKDHPESGCRYGPFAGLFLCIFGTGILIFLTCCLSSGIILAISAGDPAVCGYSKPAILLTICYGFPSWLFLYRWLTGGPLPFVGEDYVECSRIIEEYNSNDNDNDSKKEGPPKELELA